MLRSHIILVLLCCLAACQQDGPGQAMILQKQTTTAHNYLFLGHTYSSLNRVDTRIEQLNLMAFDQIWLGGDLCQATTEDIHTLVYLDGQFDLSSTQTHWAVGNHDVAHGHEDWIKAFTRRPLFYHQRYANLELLVLNTTATNDQDCDWIDTQFAMVSNLADTLQQASYLVVLVHHLVFDGIEAGVNTEQVANGAVAYPLFHCPAGGSFAQSIYPLLESVQNRGIQVVIVAGDLGKQVKTYQYQTTSGITLLGSGLWRASNTATYKDSVLLFHHDMEQDLLEWHFVDLEDLVKQLPAYL